MKTKKAITFTAALLMAAFMTLPAVRAVSHTSVFTTIDLSLKQPLDTRSKARLVSIGADGLVTIRFGDGSKFTARTGASFRDADGRAPSTDYKLVSVTPTKDSVVIRYETRVYLTPASKPKNPK